MSSDIIKPCNPPEPTYSFAYKKPPRSGNEINGLGETKKRQPQYVFHNPGGTTLDWQALDDFFSMTNAWPVVKHRIANFWHLRDQTGPVYDPQTPVHDAEEKAQEIKALAKQLGAELVCITKVTEEAIYQGRTGVYKNAICLGLSMDREAMQTVPQEAAAVEVMRVYRQVSKIAIALTRKIRRMGWPAKGYGNPNSTDILHIPLAINAGLGQLGKHGSMISQEHGSNFRLAAVLTDMPMAYDEPVDIAVDDLCYSCQRCVTDCPPQAIVNEKQLVRGVEKWYVDFDKCIPYFTKTKGCGICIEVCPWSRPGKGPSLTQSMLAKRKKADQNISDEKKTIKVKTSSEKSDNKRTSV